MRYNGSRYKRQTRVLQSAPGAKARRHENAPGERSDTHWAELGSGRMTRQPECWNSAENGLRLNKVCDRRRVNVPRMGIERQKREGTSALTLCEPGIRRLLHRESHDAGGLSLSAFSISALVSVRQGSR